MLRIVKITVILVAIMSTAAVGQVSNNIDNLFSPTVAEAFFEIAHEYTLNDRITQENAQKGIVLLKSAAALDSQTTYLIPDMVKLITADPSQNNFDLMHQLILNYVGQNPDLLVLKTALQYQLARLNSRQEREEYLYELLQKAQGKNSFFESELHTSLGLLLIEKTDFENALKQFTFAYNKNPYNKMAFRKITELAKNKLKPEDYLINLRYQLAENMYDLEKAVEFATMLQNLQVYYMSAKAFDYSIQLYSYLNPESKPNIKLYRSWALSLYNSEDKIRAIQIAKKVRDMGIFDLYLQSIAAKAARQTNDQDYAQNTLKEIQSKIKNEPDLFDSVNIAWFYAFIMKDTQSAIEWANKAYSQNPDSDRAASILAYNLAMDDQFEIADTLIQDYQEDQTLLLAKAVIELNDANAEDARELLKRAVAINPANFIAKEASRRLAELNSEYIPPFDKSIITAKLAQNFPTWTVPEFIPPQKAYTFQLNLPGNEFSYGSDMEGTISVTNNTQNDMVITEDSIINGNFLVSVNIDGDLEENLPEFLKLQTMSSAPIRPGQSILIPLKLNVGRLNNILDVHPQAELILNISVYIDPVTEGFDYKNKIATIEPIQSSIKRSKLNLSGKYLQNRLNAFSRGSQGQKIQTMDLFAGILKEINILTDKEPSYNYMYADWMPELLRSTLANALNSDQWVILVKTMANLENIPMTYDMTQALAANLSHPRWPVRLMALYVLTTDQAQNFAKVLNHTAEFDTNKFVRQMALALGAEKPLDIE